MADTNYIAAKTFLNLLSPAQRVKLCKQTLAGVEDRKKTEKQKIRDLMKWLDKK